VGVVEGAVGFEHVKAVQHRLLLSEGLAAYLHLYMSFRRYYLTSSFRISLSFSYRSISVSRFGCGFGRCAGGDSFIS